MTPCPTRDALFHLLGEEGPADDRAAVEAHVETCGRCQAELDRLTDVGMTFTPIATADLTSRLWRSGSPARLADDPPTLPTGGGGAGAAPWPVVAGYRILAEVGRGGMGVIYRAWQERLGRVVALKFLHADVRHHPDRRARFLNEAQLIARLHHPHVVQVYELGEQDGHPFLALEFVDGDPLSRRLNRTPQPPAAAAAALVETIARAVHAAHLQGVIHRDLKPSNILMAAGPRDAAAAALSALRGVPKVSDFGLAKLQPGPDSTADDAPAAGSDLTATGELLGTPSYMAPEQATGRRGEVGPWTDVYALGAVLYECLTGRPPFVGLTPMGTLLMVTMSEPVRPRQLQPAVPRDLETVCLKCLQKDPRRRYATAAELADDLGRVRAGEPIKARPVGAAERAVRAARKAPVATGLLGLLVAVSAAGAGLVLSQWRAAVAERDAKDVALRTARDRATDATHERNAKAAALLRAEQKEAEAARDRDRAQAALDSLASDVVENLMLTLPELRPEHRELLRRSLALYAELADAPAADEATLAARVETMRRMGVLRRRLGDAAEAAVAYRRGVALCERLVADHPGRLAYRERLLDLRVELAYLYRSATLASDGLPVWVAAAAEASALAAAHPDNDLIRARHVVTLIELALFTEEAEPATRAARWDAAEHAARAAAGRGGTTGPYQLARAVGFRAGADSRRGAPLAACEPRFREAIDLLARLAADEPAFAGFPADRAFVQRTYSDALRAAGRKADAVTEARAALAAARAAVALQPAIVDHQAAEGEVRVALALALEASDPAAAADELREAAAVGERAVRSAPGQYRPLQLVARACVARTDLAWRAGDMPAAEAAAAATCEARRAVLKHFGTVPVQHEYMAGELTVLAEVRERLGHRVGAADAARAAEPHFATARPERGGFPYFRYYFRVNRRVLTDALLATGDGAGALAAARALVECDPSGDSRFRLARALGAAAGDDPAHAAEAVAALRDAAASGYRNEAAYRTAPELAAFRGRADVQLLLTELFPAPVKIAAVETAPPPRPRR